jgi:DNA invertase Pin-like site-specific DNA recombinase
MAADQFIGYVRVSTAYQGESGLGIEAQREAIRAMIEAKGGKLVREYVEVASGGDNDRPELVAALGLCKRHKATLAVAKLDRLGRDMEMVSGVIKNNRVMVAECPNATTYELHTRAAFAHEEWNQIRTRTREALQAAKRRGVKLGSARPGHWTGREDRRAAGLRAASVASVAAFRELRADTYAIVVPIAKRMHAAGQSLNAIARHLNAENITTQRGSSWRPTQVKRVLEAAR